jgi:predicted nucleotidyltransferase
MDGAAEAASLSQRIFDDARGELSTTLGDLPLDVLLYGSVARREATTSSDFDVLTVVFDLQPVGWSTAEVLDAVEQVRVKLDLEEPGRSGLFGGAISAFDVVETVGLQADTNFTHTRRILTLLESVSVCQPDGRARLLRALLERYLAEHPREKAGAPRFLLNDVLRYWWTIAVDYQAKLWHGRDEKWGSRYLKLIISRKLTIAGTVASLFRCPPDPLEFLIAEFDKPPLARLAGLLDVAKDDSGPALDHLETVFDVADTFVEAMSSDAFREAIAQVEGRRDPVDPKRSPTCPSRC